MVSYHDEIKIKLKGVAANFPNGLKSKSVSVHKGFITKEFFNLGISIVLF
jgi:hypothetical protein